MYQRDFAYFLTVTDATPSELEMISELLKKEEFFGGIMRNYGNNDQGPIVFDTDAAGGSITQIDRTQVEEAMHKLAVSFPAASFYLQAEDVDDKSVAYEIKTHGNLFQNAELRSYMPTLSPAVPFDTRHRVHPHQDFVEKILHQTDFPLLHQQKTALINAIYNKEEIPAETLEGLVNFLDLIEDWAEHEGLFTFPELSESRKSSLTEQIQAATAKLSFPQSPTQDKNKEKLPFHD